MIEQFENNFLFFKESEDAYVIVRISTDDNELCEALQYDYFTETLEDSGKLPWNTAFNKGSKEEPNDLMKAFEDWCGIDLKEWHQTKVSICPVTHIETALNVMPKLLHLSQLNENTNWFLEQDLNCYNEIKSAVRQLNTDNTYLGEYLFSKNYDTYLLTSKL